MNINSRNVFALCEYLIRNGVDAEYISMISGADKRSKSIANKVINSQWDIICFVYSSPYLYKDALIKLINNQKKLQVWLFHDRV